MQTRRRTGVFRRYYSTSGSREIDPKVFGAAMENGFSGINVSQEIMTAMRRCLQWRLLETDNPNWTWKEAKKGCIETAESRPKSGRSFA